MITSPFLKAVFARVEDKTLPYEVRAAYAIIRNSLRGKFNIQDDGVTPMNDPEILKAAFSRVNDTKLPYEVRAAYAIIRNNLKDKVPEALQPFTGRDLTRGVHRVK